MSTPTEQNHIKARIRVRRPGGGTRPWSAQCTECPGVYAYYVRTISASEAADSGRRHLVAMLRQEEYMRDAYGRVPLSEAQAHAAQLRAGAPTEPAAGNYAPAETTNGVHHNGTWPPEVDDWARGRLLMGGTR